MLEDLSEGSLDAAYAKADALGAEVRAELDRAISKFERYCGTEDNTLVRVFRGSGEFSLLFEVVRLAQYSTRVAEVVELKYMGPDDSTAHVTPFGSTAPVLPEPLKKLHEQEPWLGWRAFRGGELWP